MKKEKRLYFHYDNTINSPFMFKKLGLRVPSNIFYINDRDEEFFYIPFFEYDFFNKYSRHPGIKNLSKISRSEDNYFEAVINFLKKKKKTVIVPALFPAWLFERMLKSGLKIKTSDYYFFKQLLYKERREIKLIKKTARGVRNCFVYIENIFKETTSRNNFVYYNGRKFSAKDLARKIEKFLLDCNIRSRFLTVASGKYAYYPHCQINHFLECNKTIIIDLVASDIDNGYCVDMTRTYCLGGAGCESFSDLYDIVKETLIKLEKNAFPGKFISMAYEDAANFMFNHGIRVAEKVLPGNSRLPVCYHSLGHGIGLEMHELPAVNKNAKVCFEKNMVLAFEPGAYVKGAGGIRIEDTCLITEKGVENLTGGKYNFLIKKK